ncbi:MAG: putative acid phosphatase [Ignavibacteria bacterium]|nr:putative acid phosphatase [Ignavibacteria bacterium]
MVRTDYNILVTNDDGIDSPGIHSLVRSMSKIGHVIVAAPDRQQSAVSHAMSVDNPLRVTQFHRNGEAFGFGISGTPSDCVKLAISALMDSKPDLVVSGINHGQNTSVNVLYSGTVAAACEGMLLGIPSIAVSIDSYDYSFDCHTAADITLMIAIRFLEMKTKGEVLLNVNVPALTKEKIKGIKITHLSDSVWNDKYEKRTDPLGRHYYWFSGDFIDVDPELNSDIHAVQSGYVSVTPIHYDLTNYDYIKSLRPIEELGY